jgi:hypothetical protein
MFKTDIPLQQLGEENIVIIILIWKKKHNCLLNAQPVLPDDVSADGSGYFL